MVYMVRKKEGETADSDHPVVQEKKIAITKKR